MTWTETSPGVTESGFYRINQGVMDYTIWFTHSKNFKLIGRARTLSEAKGDVVRYIERHREL